MLNRLSHLLFVVFTFPNLNLFVVHLWHFHKTLISNFEKDLWKFYFSIKFLLANDVFASNYFYFLFIPNLHNSWILKPVYWICIIFPVKIWHMKNNCRTFILLVFINSELTITETRINLFYLLKVCLKN